ncbi:apolipoprotein N-acyltransferase [Yoonia sp. SS1-5]|uniref:Apolipoprotein N-acyltransferase n=1 Tax=Yoonia rhodophyticola TaxID=3137370 RepID=A0AAN0M8N7_9RHOB
MPDLSARFAALPFKMRLIGLAATGVFAALGQAPLNLFPATILGLMLVLHIYRAASTPRQAAWYLWAFGFGYFAFALRWIIEPFLVDIARHGWMAPFALFLMAAGAGLFWAVAGWLAARLAPRNRLMLVIAIASAEIARALVLTGFPWALLGHSLVDTPAAQLAAWGGAHLLTLIIVLAAWCLTNLLARPVFAVLFALIVGGATFAVIPAPAAAPSDDAPLIRMVQPNAPQHQKWDPAYRDVFFNRLVDYSRADAVPDLIVWPETAVASLLNYVEPDTSLLVEATRGAPLVFGIQRQDDAARFYNSFVVMGPTGEIDAVYDKSHLVPFGEYIPGRRLVARLGLTGLADRVGGFTPGQNSEAILIPGIGNAIALICYEGIFAEEIARDGARPRLIVLITNDAWFGKAAGPYQHLAQARLRAIEQGLPMVRVANTGVTAMIDGQGRVRASIPLGQEGAIDAPLPPALPATVYVAYGDMTVFIVLLLLTLGVYLKARRDTD